MPSPFPSRRVHPTIQERYLRHMQEARVVTDLGLFEGVNAPRPPRPVDRFNARLAVGAQLAIAFIVGALMLYGVSAEAGVALLARV